MEERLRPRLLTVLRTVALAGVPALAGCADAEPDAPTTPPVVDERPALDAARAIVARSHGARQGSFDRVMVELRRAPGDPPATALVALPDRLRLTRADGSTLLHRSDGAWAWAGGDAARDASPAERAELEGWLAAFDLILLQPLAEADAAERTAADRLVVHRDVTHGGDARIAVTYDPSSDAARALQGERAGVTVVESYDSGTTRIPTTVEIRGDGVWQLRFLDTGVGFDADAFARPDESSTPPTLVIGGAAGSVDARVEPVDAVSWLKIEDPAAWDARMEFLAQSAARLGAMGFENGGDPMLVDDGEHRWLVLPFRPAGRDEAPIAPRDGEVIEERPAGRVVAVDPPPGPFAERVEAAARTVRQHAAERGVVLEGAICVAINLIGSRPDVDPSGLDDAPVRVFAPVAR